MANGGFSNSEEILQGILTGQVPRQIRLFAAQGLLPISREDLFRLQAALTTDPEDEIAQLATQSLKSVEASVLAAWIEDNEISAIELDLVARVIRDEAVWTAIARHRNVSDETLCVFARNGGPTIQDILITNQVRILGCLELLDCLRANDQVSKVILRRVREFEQEFIEKVAATVDVSQDELADIEIEGFEDEPRSSIDEEVEVLRSFGAQIPSEEELPFEAFEDPAVEEAARKGGSAFSRIVKMDVKQKMLLGIKGTREERAILINSRNKLVLRAVLSSPKLSDGEVEKFAASKSVADEVIRVIIQNPRWMRRYAVISAIVQNPKTPAQTALRMLPQLSPKDLKILGKDRNVSSIIRRRAKEMAEAKSR